MANTLFGGAFLGEITFSVTEILQQLTSSSWATDLDLSMTIESLDFQGQTDPKQHNFDMYVSSIALFHPQINLTHVIFSDIASYAGTSGNETVSHAVNVNANLQICELQSNINISLGENAGGTVIQMSLTGLSLGKILNTLLQLVSPTLSYSAPAPWDRVLDLTLPQSSLRIDVTAKTVSLTYDANLTTAFGNIQTIVLSYDHTQPTLEQRVAVAIEGTILGNGYSQNQPLFYPLSGQPPSIPGKQAMLHLQYLGIGQHLQLNNTQSGNLDGILDALGGAVSQNQAVLTGTPGALIPTTSVTNPLSPQSQLAGLSFNASCSWLLGAQFDLVNTVSLGVLFNDPQIYGLSLALGGPRAGMFSGLSFEIVYRRVNATIGEYILQLMLPSAMRHFKLGDVNITLPMIGVDIYTNGNFEIDFGFPYHDDFSDSFGISVAPVVGSGGFYFGSLDGATCSQLPALTPGQGHFSPVIALGFGVDVGVGSNVSAGVLSAGFSVTVSGILQGIYAPYHPFTAGAPSGTFYEIAGCFGIHGRLYGSVNFIIIRASVDIAIDADADIAVIAHQPIQLYLDASVSASVSIHFLFFTVHHSFSTDIHHSFTMGSDSEAPWGDEHESPDPHFTELDYAQ